MKFYHLSLALAYLVAAAPRQPSPELADDEVSDSADIGLLWFGGLANDAAEITHHTLELLVGVSCQLQAPIHVMINKGADDLLGEKLSG